MALLKGLATMILIVGLGNPGGKYTLNRHNIGYMAVDEIADVHNFSPERMRFQGMVREGTFETDEGRIKAIILKPTTFMNESGRSVGEAARFYKIPPEDIIVFHDELDLPAEKVKVKTGGGTAGHNGLKSIGSHIGKDFRRVRIGISHPGDRGRVSGHVLGDFAKSDHEWVDKLLTAIGKSAPQLAAGKDATFMNEVTLALRPEPKPAHKKKPEQEPKQDDSDGL